MKPFIYLALPMYILFSNKISYAAQIAFFKSFNAKGEPIVFEGVYSHAAINYKGRWLHAHPYYKVGLSESLKDFGPHYIVLENPDYPEPTDEFVEQQLKMHFNIFADWNSKTETYCSKLVGQALNMTPTKMRFQSPNWKVTAASNYRGKLGLSPSDIYWHLRRNLRFKTVPIEKIDEAVFFNKTSVQKPKTCDTYLN
jgi:hypothetical protein